MAPAVAIAAEPAREAAEEDYDQDNDEYRSKRHGALPEGPRASPKTPPRPGSKHIPGRESLVDPPKRGHFPSPLVGEGGSLTRSGSETDEGSVSAERTPHPPCLRQGTFSHKGRRKGGLLLRLVDRQHLQRRRIGLDAKGVLGDQADLVQRRLLEITAGGFAHRVLPRAHRALGDQHLG